MRRQHSLAAALAACVLLAACGPGGDSTTAASNGAGTQAPAGRPARVNGHPNLNGVWQAMNTAYWNLEGGPAQAGPALLGDVFEVDAGLVEEVLE